MPFDRPWCITDEILIKISFSHHLRLYFRVVRAQPVDLFPLTPHHELVFLLLRGEARKRFEERENVKDVKTEATVKPEQMDNE